MVARNPYTQYNYNKIMSATPRELTLMLYEGAIKFCNVAIVAIEKNDIEQANMNIKRAGKIIDHLRLTLDMSFEVSNDFERMYAYISNRLVESNFKKDAEILEEVLTHLRSIRDTWKEAMVKAPKEE